MKKSSPLSVSLIASVLLIIAMTAMSPVSGGELPNSQEVTITKSAAAKWKWILNRYAGGSPVTASENSFSPTQFILNAGNSMYRVYIQNNPVFGVGLYTFTTGPSHPVGANQNILFGDGIPLTSFNTIHSYSSGKDYIPFGLANSIPGVTAIGQYGTVTPIGMTGFRMTYMLPGSGQAPDALTIISDLNVNGTGPQDSFIEVTTTVINNGTAPIAIGIRYLWDSKVAEDDGPTFQEINPDGPVRKTEASFSASQFEQYEIRDNDVNPRPPTFSVRGTVTGPMAMKPTLPDLLQYVCWSEAVKTGFGYRIDPSRDVATDGVPCQLDQTQGGDSAVLYFFGATPDTALIIKSGGMQKISASVWAIP